MSKVYPDAKTALAGLLHDNMTIAALHESGVKGLTIGLLWCEVL